MLGWLIDFWDQYTQQQQSPPPSPPPPPGGAGEWHTVTASHPIRPTYWTAGKTHGKALATGRLVALAVAPNAEPAATPPRFAVVSGGADGTTAAAGQLTGLARARAGTTGTAKAIGYGAVNRSVRDDAAILAILMAA